MTIGRILIVEDDAALLRGLRDTFASKGLEVLTAQDGESGLATSLSSSPDLILLDLMLPRVNGYEICRAVRERGLEMPILMLTAKGQEEDIILGLNLGADDYITKPFRRGELLARAQAFLRRARVREVAKFQFGSYELDLQAHKLLRRGCEVELTAKEFALLRYFVRRRGCALARNDILDAVWGNTVIVTGRSVDRCVATLRAKLQTDPSEGDLIQTIRDIGYRFNDGGSDSGRV
ncbi:MAG: response regulator transcription factor [Acidobacteriota bacterium]